MNEERGTKKQKERKEGCVAGNTVTMQLFYLEEEQNKQPPYKYPSKLCHQLAWVSLHCLFYLFIVSLVFIPSCSVFISLCCLVARPPFCPPRSSSVYTLSSRLSFSGAQLTGMIL